ncbi:hypothetical protein, partial [Fodinibius halophilus]|uniref:hypothetical protein n=1 Tax=Fodinibius halophilus TaxID=1736908 RepID=UPI00197A9490
HLGAYASGLSSPNGRLYLGVGKNYFLDPNNRLWIHEFSKAGKLSRRYKLESEEQNLPVIFDMDFSKRRIFVVTENAEIRVYPF